MLTDQKHYFRYLQILSDLVCYLLLCLVFLPLILTLTAKNCGSLFDLGNAPKNICIYKSFAYLIPCLLIILLSTLFAVLMKRFIPSPTREAKFWFFPPLVLSIIHLPLLLFLLLMCGYSLTEATSFALVAGAVIFLILGLNRLHLLWILEKAPHHDYLIRHIIIAGTNQQALDMAGHIQQHPETGLRFKGFITGIPDRTSRVHPAAGPVLGHPGDLQALTLAHCADAVIASDDPALTPHMDHIYRACATMGIEFASSTVPSKTEGAKQVSTEYLGKTRLTWKKFILVHPKSAIIKRVFDFTAASMLIFLCLPFWIAISLMIKTDSRGPVFFRQERIGKSGKRFTLYKFRSMRQDAEEMQEALMHLNEMDGPAFKIKDDPRQTATGSILRKHSLDELPQLFNVFLGDISLVGPRPAKACEVHQYKPAERRRLSATQGITCIWQVSGRNDIRFDEWMKLDLMYVDTWSSVLDFKILFRTIPAVLMKKGAY